MSKNSLNVQNPIMLKAWGMGFKEPSKTMDSVKVAGRLAYLVDTWKVLTKDTWVLTVIEGYQIPLIGNPYNIKGPQKVCSKKSRQVFCKRKWIPFCRREPSLLSQTTQGVSTQQYSWCPKQWSNETCDQLEVSQSVGGGPTFQNGGQFPVPHNPFQLSTQHAGNCFLSMHCKVMLLMAGTISEVK